MTPTHGNATSNGYEYNFLSGLIVGGLAGIAISLLWAPRSGEQTRRQLQDKSVELRDQLAHTVEDTKARVETTVAEAKAKAEALEKQAETFVIEEKERVTKAMTAARKAAQEAWVEGDHHKEKALLN